MVVIFIPPNKIGVLANQAPSVPLEEQYVESFFISLNKDKCVLFNSYKLKELRNFAYGKILKYYNVDFKLYKWRMNSNDLWNYLNN